MAQTDNQASSAELDAKLQRLEEKTKADIQAQLTGFATQLADLSAVFNVTTAELKAHGHSDIQAQLAGFARELADLSAVFNATTAELKDISADLNAKMVQLDEKTNEELAKSEVARVVMCCIISKDGPDMFKPKLPLTLAPGSSALGSGAAEKFPIKLRVENKNHQDDELLDDDDDDEYSTSFQMLTNNPSTTSLMQTHFSAEGSIKILSMLYVFDQLDCPSLPVDCPSKVSELRRIRRASKNFSKPWGVMDEGPPDTLPNLDEKLEQMQPEL